MEARFTVGERIYSRDLHRWGRIEEVTHVAENGRGFYRALWDNDMGDAIVHDAGGVWLQAPVMPASVAESMGYRDTQTATQRKRTDGTIEEFLIRCALSALAEKMDEAGPVTYLIERGAHIGNQAESAHYLDVLANMRNQYGAT